MHGILAHAIFQGMISAGASSVVSYFVDCVLNGKEITEEGFSSAILIGVAMGGFIAKIIPLRGNPEAKVTYRFIPVKGMYRGINTAIAESKPFYKTTLETLLKEILKESKVINI